MHLTELTNAADAVSIDAKLDHGGMPWNTVPVFRRSHSPRFGASKRTARRWSASMMRHDGRKSGRVRWN